MRSFNSTRRLSGRLALLTTGLLLIFGSIAQAHFVWLDLGGTKDKPVGMYFGEATISDSASLLDHVKQTELYGRDSEGNYHRLTMEKQVDGQLGHWVAGPEQKDAEASWKVLEAVCDYGVLAKGDASFQLWYHAKYANKEALSQPALLRSEKLGLDVIPTLTDDQLQLEVRAGGKPVADAEVVISDEADKATTLQTDAKGLVTLAQPEMIRYHIRARHIDPVAGEREGKKYDSIRHYSTLVLDLGDAKAAQ
ncbi:MAG: hypothetical protein WD045_12495 [Pirellulaceae bacterium]